MRLRRLRSSEGVTDGEDEMCELGKSSSLTSNGCGPKRRKSEGFVLSPPSEACYEEIHPGQNLCVCIASSGVFRGSTVKGDLGLDSSCHIDVGLIGKELLALSGKERIHRSSLGNAS